MNNYTVLMSVYYKEKAEYLRNAAYSIYNQTYKTNEFILVCDGTLTNELESVITEMQELFKENLIIVRLKENSGLGAALNEGLNHCTNELVGRMDSDDYSYSNRFYEQVKYMDSHPDICILSGTIEEFIDQTDNIIGKRQLPTDPDDIISFSKKRNPFNHPAVMFRKEAVIDSGGYNEDFHLFEDYYLWIRMLKKGYQGANLQIPLVKMRTSTDQMLRRGGMKYGNSMISFRWWLFTTKWSSFFDFVFGALPHYIVCLLPNKVRLYIYRNVLRSH